MRKKMRTRKHNVITRLSDDSTYVLEINSQQWFSKIANDIFDFEKIFKQADSFCRDCKVVSPMICVEQCEIWRAKKEIIGMNRVLKSKDHKNHLINALKNEKRRIIIEELSKNPHTITGLQEHIKNNGYSQSRYTIAREYIEPLIKTGLIRNDGDTYRLTLYGRKVREVLRTYNVTISLPIHSNCHEESILEKLMDGPKSYEDFNTLLDQRGLSRSLKRLSEKGLVTKSQSLNYIFYFKTKKVPKSAFTPTEERIYENIPEVGISSSELSTKVGINLRRTYKYLRRLRRRKLVFTRKKLKTYALTISGRKIAKLLEEITNVVINASRASNLILQSCSKPAS